MQISATAMVETLVPIWCRVLRLPSVGIDDNFFDLGGDSVLTLELFHQVALACGRELPLVMIYHAPTIASLAALLEQPALPPVPPLVLLKAGSEEPPIFIAHGLGGSAMDFYQVIKQMRTSHAVYGMQGKGINGVEEPLDRIEDMARYFLGAVRQLQPHGPYYLIGFSLGGLVTLEMAQQLTAGGEKVGLLAMLDSYPHIDWLPWGQRARLVIRQASCRAAAQLKWLGISLPYQRLMEMPVAPSLQKFLDSSYKALKCYQPQFYPGKISFVRAAIPTNFPADATAVWSGLARQLDLRTVPGDHLGIMTTHSESLALAVSDCLREAFFAQRANVEGESGGMDSASLDCAPSKDSILSGPSKS